MNKLVIAALLAMMATTSQAKTVNEFNRDSVYYQDMYLIGLINGVWLMEPKDYQCGPDNQTVGQNMAILRKYIYNHPEDWTYDVGANYLIAIREAYHCEALPKSKV